LRADFDAVVLAAGLEKYQNAHRRRRFRRRARRHDFLRDVALGEPPHIGQRVAVCGGGNTAMDACRTAVRLGADKVYVIYRARATKCLPKTLRLKRPRKEGVIFKFLTNPSELLIEDGTLKGVKLQLMELGEPDAGGRRNLCY
jgi:formate dehydrogenase major subunit